MTLTRDVSSWRVLRAAHSAGTDPSTGWGAMSATPTLRPLRVAHRMAPDVHTAQVELDLGQVGDHAWQWADYVDMDDRIAIISSETLPAERTALFQGFVAESELEIARNERCTLTAVGHAHRLKRDVIVYGRYMEGLDGTVRLYPGLPCSFNAGGRPNRSPTTHAVEGAPEGIYVFTPDDWGAGNAAVGEHAEWWNLAAAINYLQWYYNASETWMVNAAASAWMRSSGLRIQADCNGRDLWSSLAQVCDLAGADVWEDVTNDGDDVASAIRIVQRGEGDAYVVNHQDVNVDGSLPVIDLDETNVAALQMSRSVTDAVTRPIVGGGRPIYEVEELELQLAEDLDALASGWLANPAATEGSGDLYDRYCVGGDSFEPDAGRLWVANEDGEYTSAGLAQTNMADAAGRTGEYWPPMATPAVNRPEGITATERGSVEVEYTTDGGTTWRELRGAEILPGRMGIRITEPNLAAIPSSDPAQVWDAFGANFFAVLASSPADVAVRITCGVAAPDRRIEQPAARADAATAFGQAAWYDRSRMDQTTHHYAGGDIGHLDDVASDLQGRLDGAAIEASLPIEWPETGVALGDTIEQVAGIGLSLARAGGAAPVYPRIVGLDWLLTPDAWQTVIHLGSTRYAGSE